MRLPWLSLAPMVDVSEAGFRFLSRMASRGTVIYSPMLVDAQLLCSPAAQRSELLVTAPEESRAFGPGTGGVIAQLGGSHPEGLVRAARAVESTGMYDGVNINMGCPASTAQDSFYGARLMQLPEVRRR